MNKHFYLKHEIMAFNDPRVQNMLRQEGGKAYGAYWYIMEKLSLLPDMEAELKYLKPFATRNFTYPYMMKIVTKFGLFTVTDSCFSPVQLNTKCVAEPQKAEENTAENSGQNGKKYPDNDVKPGKNAGFSTKNRQTMDKKRDGNESEMNCNTPNISGLSNENLQQKENIRDIITTAAARKEKKTAVAVVDDLSAVALTERNRTLSPGISSFVIRNVGLIIPNATLQCLNCHTSLPQLPHFSAVIATPQHSKYHTSRLIGCGIGDDEVWYSKAVSEVHICGRNFEIVRGALPYTVYTCLVHRKHVSGRSHAPDYLRAG